MAWRRDDQLGLLVTGAASGAVVTHYLGWDAIGLLVRRRDGGSGARGCWRLGRVAEDCCASPRIRRDSGVAAQSD